MASVVKRKNGSREVRFSVKKGERRSLYLGHVTHRFAESIGKRLDSLAFCVLHKQTPDVDLSEWMLSLDDRYFDKLVEWGLAKARPKPEDRATAMTVGRWVDKCIARGNRKESTKEQLKIAGDNLRSFLGEDKLLVDVTGGDAEDFRAWLQTKGRSVGNDEEPQGLAFNTVRRRIGRAKEFFAAAVRHQLITINPFLNEASAVGANVERQAFIPADWIERCIKVAPCEDWRIILAFARYAGMRSHETRLQKWEDIDIANARMIVRSEKNPPSRVCPIFPELMPHIRRAKEFAPPGAVYVQTRYAPMANIGTTFTKIIERAGLVPWERLFQNLRATRETELMAAYPAKDVASWLGNSAPVAMKHYAMAMKDSFDRAIREGTASVVKDGESCHHAVQKSTIQEPIRGNQDAATDLENTAKDVLRRVVTFCDVDVSYPARTRNQSAKDGTFEECPELSPYLSPCEFELRQWWNSLDENTRERWKTLASGVSTGRVNPS